MAMAAVRARLQATLTLTVPVMAWLQATLTGPVMAPAG